MTVIFPKISGPLRASPSESVMASQKVVICEAAALTCSEQELIQLAIQSLGLDELEPFDPDQRIIEKVLQEKAR